MHSFSAMRKVEKENKNTSPRTAPAMSCERLKNVYLTNVVLLHCYMIPKIYLQKEYCLACFSKVCIQIVRFDDQIP